MEHQKPYIENLLNLIKENPSLPILPMVKYETVGGDDFAYWAGKWGDAHLEEFYQYDDIIYFKSRDFNDLVDDEIKKMLENNSEPDDENLQIKAIQIINNLPWQKVITVRIEEF